VTGCRESALRLESTGGCLDTASNEAVLRPSPGHFATRIRTRATEEEERVRKRVSIGVLLAAVGALALLAAGCGGSNKSSSGSTGGGGGGGNVTALPASSCGPIQFKGSGSPDYLIAS